MSRKMSHLQIIGLKTDLLAAIRELGRLGCVHIDSLAETPEFSTSRLTLDAGMVRRQEELSLKLLQINGLIDTLGLPKNAKPITENADEPVEHALPAVE